MAGGRPASLSCLGIGELWAKTVQRDECGLSWERGRQMDGAGGTGHSLCCGCWSTAYKTASLTRRCPHPLLLLQSGTEMQQRGSEVLTRDLQLRARRGGLSRGGGDD